MEHCSANAEAVSSNPVEAPRTFCGLALRLLKSQSQLLWSVVVIFDTKRRTTRLKVRNSLGNKFACVSITCKVYRNWMLIKFTEWSSVIVLRKGHRKAQVALVFYRPGVTGEQELILLRAGIFSTQQDVSDLTICPFHRSELGTGWRRSSNTCRVPNEIAYHSQGKENTKSVKGDRGVFSPCTVFTHDQWKNLIFCLINGYFLFCTHCRTFCELPILMILKK